MSSLAVLSQGLPLSSNSIKSTNHFERNNAPRRWVVAVGAASGTLYDMNRTDIVRNSLQCTHCTSVQCTDCMGLLPTVSITH